MRAAGGRSARARDPLPPQLRPDGGVRGRLRSRARPPHRHFGRRPAERPARHPGDGRDARARLRHRVRLAEGPQGSVPDAAAAVDDRQRADLARDRRAPARLRLLAEGVPRRGREADEAVRRDAPLPAGDRQRAGRDDRRGRREPPRAAARAIEVRHLAHGARRPRSADGQVPAELFDAPAADLRAASVSRWACSAPSSPGGSRGCG